MLVLRGSFQAKGFHRGIACGMTAVFVFICVSSALFPVWGEDPVVSSVTANVKVYVLSFDEVGSHVVGNLSHSVLGALSTVSFTHVIRFYEVSLGEQPYVQPVNIMGEVIADWNRYINVIEAESDAIVVNAHGDTLPVPSSYSKEAWIAKIAEAILQRNVTFVNTGGYPLYYFHVQGGEDTVWGEDGFRQFMANLGIDNVTCKDEHGSSSFILADFGHALSFVTRDLFYFAEAGYVLDASDFGTKLMSAIWGSHSSVALGAVVKFAGEGFGTSGYYVHIGALRTFDTNLRVTDADFSRSCCGTAAALYMVVLRFAVEHKDSPDSPKQVIDAPSVFFLACAAATIVGTVGYTCKKRKPVLR